MDTDQLTQAVQALQSQLSAITVQLNTQVQGLFECVSVVPTGKPSNVYDQVKIYASGGTKTLYLYDYINSAWRSVTLT